MGLGNGFEKKGISIGIPNDVLNRVPAGHPNRIPNGVPNDSSNVVPNLTFYFRELGHCPMISHYYALKEQKLLFIDKGHCLTMERAHR